DVAFPYTVAADGERLLIEFELLDGYYLYRQRFGFESGTDGVELAAPRFPRGEIHSDEFFGEQEIYRHDFAIEIPYRHTGDARELNLDMKLQGCADIGVCYLPQDWTRAVQLPA